MLRVLSDIGLLTAADVRRVTLLRLLEVSFSSIFDCVDHGILSQRMDKNFRLT